MREKKYYTYILRCADDTLYTGWTTDIEKRFAAHNAGQGAKYTRSRTPVELVFVTVSDTKERAMSLEYKIKRLTREQKIAIIDSGELPREFQEVSNKLKKDRSETEAGPDLP